MKDFMPSEIHSEPRGNLSFRMLDMESAYSTKGDCKELCYLLVDLVKAAHLEHVNTNNYARHMALDELYSDLPDQIDSLLEMVVMYYGAIHRCDCPEDFNTHFSVVLAKIEECIDNCDITVIETTLGDVQKFLIGIKYKLERLE
ncbi:starvation-inducible transcriptional regulator [Vibrio phage Vp_R1]|uniref:Uncharacterized protein n=1 Tax=Vibrio phage Vp_R1 TaxID=2059867 RepID=A0A2H5BQ55_9CAUD|nr:starvation-inducible transcriptional regulator [Vibrio phage Vp_R1]AUG88469.1 hypothetical protein VPR_105 [Vibrio phage Vp_R1]